MESHCYTYYGYTWVETCNEKEQGRIGLLIHCSTNLLYVHASWIMPFIIWKGCQSSYDTIWVWILITKPQKWSPTCSIRASIRWLSWTQLYQLFAIIISVPSHSNHYSVYWSSIRLIRRRNWNWSNFAHPSFHVHIKIVIGSSTGVFACRYSMGSVQPPKASWWDTFPRPPAIHNRPHIQTESMRLLELREKEAKVSMVRIAGLGSRVQSRVNIRLGYYARQEGIR